MSANFYSTSPINGEVLWHGESSSPAAVDAAMQQAAAALLPWRNTAPDERIEIVRRFGQQLESGRQEMTDLIVREIGKLPWDASGEVGAAIAKIELSIQAYQQRRFDSPLEGGQDGGPERVIRYQPIGVCLVLGPFNFPLHLPGGQMIPALLAGNTIVFKPSDQATAVGKWMTDAWHAAGLPAGVLQMITGGVETAVSAIDARQVAGVFLTGSLAAGRAIHRQLAGRPEVLLALELGGNNPVVISGDAATNQVASMVSFSAFISAGQRCTCARRAIFIESDSTASQIDAMVASTQGLRVGLPGDEPTPHVGPLISAAAAEGLRKTYDRLIQLGCTPIIPFHVDPRSACLVHPAIVEANGLDEAALHALGEMEWFGPLLVVQRATDFDQALSLAADTSYGLAASLLGGSREMFDRFVGNVGAGVVNWNGPTTGAAGALPFGGLGASGNHRPAGFFAIDFCNDPVASLERSEMAESDPWSVVK